jgi:transposase InsO family protein
LDSIFATFGKVHTVKTDNGPPFHGHQFREYAEKKGFYHHRITPRHPRANGECERFMQNLNKAIRISKKENTDYKEKIDGMLEAYRATPHPSTSKSPFELMFCRKMNLNIFPTMKRKVKDEVLRNRDEQYKNNAKK